MLSFRRTKAGRIVAVLVLMMMLIGTLPPGTAFAEEPEGLEPVATDNLEPLEEELIPEEEQELPDLIEYHADNPVVEDPGEEVPYTNNLVIPSQPMRSPSKMMAAAEPEWPAPGTVTTSKAAEPTGNPNEWEITLQVESRDVPTSSDIVLVIDTSGSMRDNSKLTNAKTAANAFVTTLLEGDNAVSTNTRIAIVPFASSIGTVTEFTNDATVLHSAINGLSSDGGTFTQAGMHQAKVLLDASTAGYKNIVLLSDGQPTYNYPMVNPDDYLIPYGTNDFETRVGVPAEAFNYDGYRVGDGGAVIGEYERYYTAVAADDGRYFTTTQTLYSNWSATNIANPSFTSGGLKYYLRDTYYTSWRTSFPYRDLPRYNRITHVKYYNSGNAAIDEAGYAKAAGYTVYTIALDAGETGTPILNAMASPGKAYNATPAELTTIFNEIAGRISAAVQDATVSDPMGLGFVIPGVTAENLDEKVTVNQGDLSYNPATKTVTWDIGNMTTVNPAYAADTTYKIATMTYLVSFEDVFDDISNAFLPGYGYATNGPTVLHYTDYLGYDQSLNFTIPNVLPDYGRITKVYYRVNEQGQPITSDGIVTVRTDPAAQFKREFVVTEGGSSYLLEFDDTKTPPSISEASGPATETSFTEGATTYTFVKLESSDVFAGVTKTVSQEHPFEYVWFAYQPGVRYDITYDAGGADGTVPTDGNTYLEGATVTTQSANTLSKTGHDFSGWLSSADGNTYAAGATFAMTGEDVTLTAQWTPQSNLSYIVRYLEQGTQAILKTAKTVQNQTYGTSKTENAETIVNYTVIPPDSQTKTIELNTVFTFYYNKNIIPVDPGTDPKAGYVRIAFLPGANGTLTPSTNPLANSKLDFDVLIGTPYSEVAALVPTIHPTDGYVANGWDPLFPPNLPTVQTAQDYTAQYLKEIIPVNPEENPDPRDGYVRIAFLPGAHGELTPSTNTAAEGKTHFDVLIDTAFSKVKALMPTVEPFDGYTHTGWNPALPADNSPVNEDKDYTATYAALSGIQYKVEHYKANDDASYPATATDTDTLYGSTGDEVEAVTKTYAGYTFDPDAPGSVLSGTILGDGTLVLKVYYQKNIIPVDPGDPETSDKYVRISFLPGDHGRLIPNADANGKVHFDVKIGTPFGEVRDVMPSVQAERRWRFDGWQPTLPGDRMLVEEDAAYTAQYERRTTDDNDPTDPTDPTDPEQPPLPPVTPENPEAPELIKDDHFAYMFGYPDGSFQATGNITRAEVTVMFSRLMVEKMADDVDYPSPFSDVAGDAWYARNVGFMTTKGIIRGYPDGTFRPDAPVTRAEFAAIASRFDKLVAGESNFSDVAADHWAKQVIDFAFTKGWVSGYPDGTFKPENATTRAETISIVNKMLERVADKDFVQENKAELVQFNDLSEAYWAYYPITEATNGHDYEWVIKGQQEDWLNLKDFNIRN